MKSTLQHCTFVPSFDEKRLPLNFVLCDCPPVNLLAEYAQFFAKHRVLCVCRICDSSNYKAGDLLQLLQKQYKTDLYKDYDLNSDAESLEISKSDDGLVTKVGRDPDVQVCLNDGCHFEDGGVPSVENIKNWLNLVDQCISLRSNHKALQPSDQLPAIAVHCVSGLGRAPVLIAIAVMEYCTEPDALDVVTWLRTFRRGAFNNNQLHWLENEYTKKLRKKYGPASHSKKRKPNTNIRNDITKSNLSIISVEPDTRQDPKFSFKRLFKNPFKRNNV